MRQIVGSKEFTVTQMIDNSVRVIRTVDGILLLGGEPNGLNFEIEYLNRDGKYMEALYSIAYDHANADVDHASTFASGLLVHLGKRDLLIQLPGGLKKLLAFRRPLALGGRRFNPFV